MRVLARRKRESLTTIMGSVERGESGLEAISTITRSSSRGWLHAVPAKVHSVGAAPSGYRMQSLSALDVTRVNQATIREGESHRIWPPSVLRQFNQASVITKSRIKHYELHDTNLTRVL